MKRIILVLVCVALSVQAYTVDTIMIPMRDSVRLATTVYYPPDSFPLPRPVVLNRTPYHRDMDTLLLRILCDYFGYVVMAQNVRGTYDSEGEPLIFLSDGWGPLKDGYDAIEWIASQDTLCNGRIGMFGASAHGMTQYYASGTRPPHLTVCAPIAAGPSLYHHVAYVGGEFRKALVETWLNGVGTPWLIDTVANHPIYDSMWSWVDLTSRWDSANYPMYHIFGWFDLYTDGQIDAFKELQVRFGKQKMYIGPWGHGDAWGTGQQGDLVFPPNAEMSMDYALNQLLRWYSYFLYDDTTNGILDEPPIRFYLMGDCDTQDTTYWNKWIDAYDWPLPEMSYRNFYLHENGILDTLIPNTTEKPDTYIYDPQDPCPTIGGREYIGIPYDSTTGLGGYGPRDQRPIESRPDVVIYTTEVLQEPVAVIGKIIMVLYASSDRLDTDFSVRVTDVYPDGRSILLTDNILKARHRHGFDREDFLTPGVVDTFIIDVWSTAYVFNTGHRIRVIISSSNYPRFEKNPNTGAPFRRDDPNTLIATNVIYHDSQYPSYLMLPVVPFSYIIARNSNDKTKIYPEILLNNIGRNIKITLNTENSDNLRIDVFDITGRKIKQIYYRRLNPGKNSFIFSASSGVYFLRFKIQNYTKSKKIIILK